MTGNTWDIIKIQTKTNQLMMGNRKDHIRVRGQRQRKTKSDSVYVYVTIGTPLRLTPATNSYMWWVVYILSPAAARGGAISADSQHCALHQPCTCHSLPFPIYSGLCPLSVSVCHLWFVLPCMLRPPLFHSAFCVQDPQARSS